LRAEELDGTGWAGLDWVGLGSDGWVASRCVALVSCAASAWTETGHDGTGAARIFLPPQGILIALLQGRHRHSSVCRTVSSAPSDWSGAMGWLWLSKGEKWGTAIDTCVLLARYSAFGTCKCCACCATKAIAHSGRLVDSSPEDSPDRPHRWIPLARLAHQYQQGAYRKRKVAGRRRSQVALRWSVLGV